MKGNGLATIKTTRSTQIVLLIGVSVSLPTRHARGGTSVLV